MSYIISGIQQVGVGVRDADEAWAWYRRHFGVDVPVFAEKAPARLMIEYTGNKVRNRYAILALNLQGGGGFEIWQYTCRQGEAPASPPQLGDLGIFAVKIKCPSLTAAYRELASAGVQLLTQPQEGACGKSAFVQDSYGNIFQLVETDDWFQRRQQLTGGIYGVIIGVSDIDRALTLYRDVLGYDQLVCDETGVSAMAEGLPGGQRRIRRVVLRHSKAREGAFAALFGKSEIELVQVLDEPVEKIYKNRFWGDLGFIHLCFDVSNMDALKAHCLSQGFPFTVDSQNSFDMGEAAGRFTYTEDPDGTLIEFVETHKIPIVKKLGWYLDLKRRDSRRPLPRWMIKAMGLNRNKG